MTTKLDIDRMLKAWHPRVEMRWRGHPELNIAPVLEQLWQCEQTGELQWRRVPVVVGWESEEYDY